MRRMGTCKFDMGGQEEAWLGEKAGRAVLFWYGRFATMAGDDTLILRIGAGRTPERSRRTTAGR